MTLRALITGAAGQDGSHLIPLLLRKGYEVHGLVRRPAASSARGVHYHVADVTDRKRVAALMRRIEPQEVYNLASRSNPADSYDDPLRTLAVDGLGAVAVMEAARSLRRRPRIFQAGSHEMFDAAGAAPRNERSAFRPKSPYGAAKLLAYWQAVNFRRGYGLFVANGLLFDHESAIRSPRFDTRRITSAAARIRLGRLKKVRVGSLDSRRDWGFSGDYAEAMWRMLQRPTSDDFVIATGRLHSVRDFCEAAFSAVGLDWKKHVETDESAAAIVGPRGDASKARRVLEWKPRLGFRRMVSMMVECELALECGEVRRG